MTYHWSFSAGEKAEVYITNTVPFNGKTYQLDLSDNTNSFKQI